MPDTPESASAGDAPDNRRGRDNLPVAGSRPESHHVRAIAPAIAAAAQNALNYWGRIQESDGSDKDLGAERVCRDVAHAMSAVLNKAGIDEVIPIQSAFDHDHIFLVANLGDGVFSIEIPPPVSEAGFGYGWTRRGGVTLQASHIFLYRLSDRLAPAAFTADFTADFTAACATETQQQA